MRLAAVLLLAARSERVAVPAHDRRPIFLRASAPAPGGPGWTAEQTWSGRRGAGRTNPGAFHGDPMNPYLDPLLLNAVAEAAAALRAALVAVGAGGADVSARGGPPRVSVVLPADAPSPLGSWTESHEFACRYWRRRVETASGWSFTERIRS